MELKSYINTLEPTSTAWAMSVKFLAEINNSLALSGFEAIQLAVHRLLVRQDYTDNNMTTSRYPKN